MIYPINIAVIKLIRSTIPALFNVCLCFNSITTPSPELTNNPATKAPKDKWWEINNSVIKTLLAQLGIKPTKEANTGEAYLLESMKFVKLASPTEAIINPKETLIIKT